MKRANRTLQTSSFNFFLQIPVSISFFKFLLEIPFSNYFFKYLRQILFARTNRFPDPYSRFYAVCDVHWVTFLLCICYIALQFPTQQDVTEFACSPKTIVMGSISWSEKHGGLAIGKTSRHVACSRSIQAVRKEERSSCRFRAVCKDRRTQIKQI